MAEARLEELALQSPNGTIDTGALRQIRLDEQVKEPVMSILTGDLLHMLLVRADHHMCYTLIRKRIRLSQLDLLVCFRRGARSWKCAR